MIKFKVVYINSVSNSLRGIGPGLRLVDRVIVVQVGWVGEMGLEVARFFGACASHVLPGR
jgi:hypothetical protein